MTTHALYVGGAPERRVGQVFATIELENAIDRGLVRRGMLGEGEVRHVRLDRVLVDTGATGLCLPRAVIVLLGLDELRTVEVSTAVGTQSTRLFGDVRLQIEDRVGTFDCLELPGGEGSLLGVVPLEALGFEPDLQARRLRKLPMGPDGSYLTIY